VDQASVGTLSKQTGDKYMRKPLLTKSVISGLAELTANIQVNAESIDQVNAVKYLSKLVDYCQSPAYVARKREISDKTQRSRRNSRVQGYQQLRKEG